MIRFARQVFRNPETLQGLALAVFAFLAYLSTMASTVGTEDPGEIATGLYSLGILHPTGYPVFTLLGHVFAHLPLGPTVIWRLNLLGALLSATAAFLFHGTFLRVLSGTGFGLTGQGDRNAPTLPRFAVQAGAAAATMIYAFSAVYWFEAVWLEVYALHLVFLALLVRLFLGALEHHAEPRRWLLFAYVVGLSFAHHMMTVLLAPAFLMLFFRVHGGGREAWKRIAMAVPPFLLALTAYLYLPLRAASKPLMNWGEPTTPGALWKHITAAQYGDQMFTSLEVAWRKLAQFTVDLPGDFGHAPLALAALGLWSLRRFPWPLLFSGLVFVTGTVYAINYTFDDPNFNLNAHFAVALWAGYGARALLAWRPRGTARILAGACVAVVALCPLAFNYPKLDKSRDTMVDDYARNVLASMDSGAVFFSNEYERLGGPVFYLQNVEGFRKDVAVLDVILLGNPWFYGYLESTHPDLLEASRTEVDAFREELDRLIAGHRDTLVHNARLKAMFEAIIENSRARGRPVYVSGNINPAMIDAYQHAPTGMVFRLLDVDDTLRVPLREPRFAPLLESNRLAPKLRWDYAQSYAYQGAYRLWLQDTLEGTRLLRKALELKPDFGQAREMLDAVTARPPVTGP